MELTLPKRWANKLASAVVSAYLAFLSRKVPWLPKLTALAVAVGGTLAGEMSRRSAVDLLSMSISFASICGAVAVMNRLVPEGLMTEFRARTNGPIIQSYVSAYFELVLLLIAAAAAFAGWHIVWPLFMG